MKFETQTPELGGFAKAPSGFHRRKALGLTPKREASDDEVIARRIGMALAQDGLIETSAIDRFLKTQRDPVGRNALLTGLFDQRGDGPPAIKRGAVIAKSRPKPRDMPVSGDMGLLSAFREAFRDPLAQRAVSRRSEATSYRSGPANWQRFAAMSLALTGGLGVLLAPSLAISTILWTGAFVVCVNAALWLMAIAASLSPKPEPAPARMLVYPRITLLAALYQEPEVAELLVGALNALKYPRDRLDVKLVLEEDDTRTLDALRRRPLPRCFEILIVPDGAPRTKPRALNYASDFAQGDIIGVYDAEDRPDPDQLLKVAAAFEAGGPDRACVQARLGYYNVRENWLTRCFELEYAAWFETLLPGLHRAGWPLPLGGTSLFLKREALEDVAAWDSHNVTEDADLGMALARAGYETALITSLTEEEASSRIGAWVKQRSRWLKGYFATWLTHMRSPRALVRDLGWWRFLGFNATLLGAVVGYLLLPQLWLIAGAAALGFEPAVDVFASGGVLVAGACAGPALIAAAGIGLHQRGRLGYLGWVLTAPVYWLLGAAAAYLAIWELITAPTLWRKTQHGVGDIATLLRRTTR